MNINLRADAAAADRSSIFMRGQFGVRSSRHFPRGPRFGGFRRLWDPKAPSDVLYTVRRYVVAQHVYISSHMYIMYIDVYIQIVYIIYNISIIIIIYIYILLRWVSAVLESSRFQAGSFGRLEMTNVSKLVDLEGSICFKTSRFGGPGSSRL